MTIPEKVAEYLQRNTPRTFCDDCLQVLLGLPRRQEAQQATKPLGVSGAFDRNQGRCHNCGGSKLVIRAN
jgi:RNase P subunit RPR2